MENIFKTLGEHFSPDTITKNLICTQCNEKQERYDQIVYSQGSKVCLSCKEANKESDKRAFDLDMRFR